MQANQLPADVVIGKFTCIPTVWFSFKVSIPASSIRGRSIILKPGMMLILRSGSVLFYWRDLHVRVWTSQKLT